MYKVMFVGDEELPAGHDFALVKSGPGDMVVFIRANHVAPDVLEQAWLAARRANGVPEVVPVPA